MAGDEEPRESELHEFVRVIVLGPVLFLIFNVLAVIPVVAGVTWAGQFLTHQEQRGELVATRLADTGGRRSQTLCYGTFRSGKGQRDVEVRVVTRAADCPDAKGWTVFISPDPGAFVRRLIAGGDESRLDTGFGFVPMAVLDHRVLMLEGWWWLVIVLSAAGYDITFVHFARRWFRRSAIRRRPRVDRFRPWPAAGAGGRELRELGPPPPPLQLLYFGTDRDSVPGILASGLRRTQAQDVWLCNDVEEARQAAQWAGRPVVFAVDATAMQRAGFVFRRSGSGWEVDHVPVRFLELQPIR